jgi:tRNA (guanine-N7-)-methyltransferase
LKDIGVSEEFPRKLYGRRKGPKLSPHKADLHRTLLPKLALTITPGADPRTYFLPPPCGEVEARSASGGGPSPVTNTAPHPDRLATLGSPTSPQGGGNCTDVWLEIGFGAGEHLLALARAHPNVGLIGAEPYEAGVAKLLTKIAEDTPTNLRLHEGDARDILSALPDGCLGRIFILFPDPWPKTRHHKRRFIQMEMLNAFARVLKPGGELRFASDDAGYTAWTLERALAHRTFAWTAKRPNDWKVHPVDWPQTRYEAKALHGPPVYLRFLRA